MKAAVEFKAATRERIGTGGARELRRQGLTPVNVYSAGNKNQAFGVETRAISNEYFRGGFMNKIVAFNVDGKNVFAIPREVQLNPVSDKIEHVDFQAVDAKSIVKVRVPVHFLNADKSIGIKRGGVLNTVAREVSLLCSVNSIPKALEIDLGAVDIGTTIHINNVTLPEGVKPATKLDLTIASITGRQKEEEADAAGAPSAAAVPSTKSAAAGAAAAAGGAAKPAAKK